ncbi:carboxypeptidase B, partial [Trichonephila inaurata madagascariensis]
MLLLAFILSVVLPAFSHENFTGHKLYGLFASDEDELNLLKELVNHPEVDVWNQPIDLYEKVNVRVPPSVAENLEKQWKSEGIDFYIIGASGYNKPALWIDSGIHAREWVSPATSLYIIEQLVKGYDTDPEMRELVDTFDWYIFPVINVDGYKYTWTFNRMWRKNRVLPRRFGTNPFCRGADPNRNFDSAFG